MDDHDSAVTEVMVIANAFRAANDEDTMQVMNTQSSKKLADLKSLNFYVIPYDWMHNAWPVLQGNTDRCSNFGQNWREDEIGRIENGPLLHFENAPVSEDDEDEDEDEKVKGMNGKEQPVIQKQTLLAELQKRKANRTPASTTNGEQRKKLVQRLQNSSAASKGKVTLQRNLVCFRDFFLVGSNVWLLLKQKFGFDQEVRLRSVFLDDGGLAVILHEASRENTTEIPAIHVPVPPTGRFPYEDHLEAPKDAQQKNVPGNVSDDENGDDMFPEIDDGNKTHSGRAILLPNSTTVSDQNMASGNNDNSSSTDDWLNTGHGDNITNHEGKADGGVFSSSDVFMGGSTNNSVVQQRLRYGSGLANLGNTCFMNTTLQCLAHTEPLQQYFLSGEYERDLNRENPLGTGGDLATQFASLLAEMWGGGSKPRTSGYASTYSDSTTHAVYPRNFKITVGKHAEQFVGYDQHDSQEFATFLLDALHEDTNKVMKKPYIEKPEQAEDETDEEAADKAWDLHLKREDSRVLENFMGQIKSRVQCCEKDCGRVSTTFDPFMFLSVPIPGSSERTLRVTFVPLDPAKRAMNLAVTVNKTATMEELLKKVREQILTKTGSIDDDPIPLDDLCVNDVWQKEIYTWYKNNDEVDRIRDNDETFIYELRSLAEVRKLSAKKVPSSAGSSAGSDSESDEDDAETERLGIRHTKRTKYFQLDVATLAKLNRGDEWSTKLVTYLKNPMFFLNAFNPKKGSSEERVKLYRRLATFIDICHDEIIKAGATGEESSTTGTGLKRTREENNNPNLSIQVSPEEEPIPELENRVYANLHYTNVKTRYDVGALEFIANKMRNEILRMEREAQDAFPDGIQVEIRMRKMGAYATEKESSLAAPFVLRIPSGMTVYELREEISRRLSRSLRTGRSVTCWSSGQPTSEQNIVAPSNGTTSGNSKRDNGNSMNDENLRPLSQDTSFGSPELLIIRQVPLSYDRKNSMTYRNYSHNSKQLGSLEKSGSQGYGSRPISLASPSDEDEQVVVSELVGDHGKVYVDWPSDLAERVFDLNEYETVDDPSENEVSRKSNGTKTVQDCIKKFCEIEQLEDTEQWYCNKCKKHVCAWKQFHLYRSPPHLIIHLKRFQFSATTLRRDKIGGFIDFPLEGLDLTEQVLDWNEEEKPIYDCYGVSNHYGGLGGGHYTAYCLHNDGVWCYYDDTRITSHVDPKEVVTQAAYVLYYRRRDVPVGQEFEMKMQTNIQGLYAASPAVIRDPIETKSHEPSDVSSSAAMVGDDEDDAMDVVDEADDNVSHVSHSTSPMGSIAGGDVKADSLYVEDHDYDEKDEKMSSLPLQ